MRISWESVKYEFDASKDKWMNKEETFEEDSGEYPENMVMGTMVSTPFGMYELNEAFNPLNHFEFWMGHTDFDIDQDFLDIVDTIPGVEALKIFSRYRFLIAIGKLFEFKQVRPLIELSLGTLKLGPVVSVIRNELLNSDKDWSMYIYPNLKDCVVAISDKEDYEQKLQEIKKLSSTGHGLVLSSELS